MGRAIALYVPLLASMVPHIGEPNQSLPSIMNEVRPTYVMGVPRTWEKIAAHMQVAIDDAGYLGADHLSHSPPPSDAASASERLSRDGRPSWYLNAIYWPLWLTVLWPALHKLGLTYAVGACSVRLYPRSCMKLFAAWGLPLRDMFGMTETGGVGAQSGKWPEGSRRSAIVPMAACDVRISTDGELCLRGPGNVLGYWNDDVATPADYSMLTVMSAPAISPPFSRAARSRSSTARRTS